MDFSSRNDSPKRSQPTAQDPDIEPFQDDPSPPSSARDSDTPTTSIGTEDEPRAISSSYSNKGKKEDSTTRRTSYSGGKDTVSSRPASQNLADHRASFPVVPRESAEKQRFSDRAGTENNETWLQDSNSSPTPDKATTSSQTSGSPIFRGISGWDLASLSPT
ncbi:MAG: hypothetical protein M1831_000696 [Alyxoria varia]|nr:MAG: hypothetical protein M1831_000696 [Alyxoria varia]